MKKSSTPWGSIFGVIAILGIIILAVVLTQNGSSDNYNFSKHPSTGPQDAKVVIDIYSDFECPACQQLNMTIMPQLMKKYNKSVKFVFRQFPLEQHAAGKVAAYASACAGEQNNFWPYHDLLVQKYSDWTQNTTLLEQYAADLGLDTSRFNSCRSSKDVKKFIEQSYSEGIVRGIDSTPTLFINNEKVVGVAPLVNYTKIIDKYLKAK